MANDLIKSLPDLEQKYDFKTNLNSQNYDDNK